MKKVFLSLMVASVLFACNEDEKVTPKDYGMKTFSADLKYVSGTPYGEVAYTQQTFFSFGNEEAVAVDTYGEDSWTEFNIFDSSSEDYNATSDVQGWDLVFTHYTGNGGEEGEDPVIYGLTGVLHNKENGISVAEFLYEDSAVEEDISQVFADLTLADVTALSYSQQVDAIGRDWKELDFNTYQYKVLSNKFYVVKHNNGNYYKIRIISFYGDSSSERIIKIEYQLLK